VPHQTDLPPLVLAGDNFLGWPQARLWGLVVRFAVLGPVEIVTDGVRTSIARPRHRALLAYLLLNANRVVSPDQMVEALWGGAEPATARSQIHVAVSALRRALRDYGLHDVIDTQPGGYRIALSGDEFDAELFTGQVAAARHAMARDDCLESARLLRAALSLWRGEALAGIKAAFAASARLWLHEQQLSAQELLADVELALGNHDTLIPELTRLAEQHPSREHLARQLILAQYRAGHRTEAMQTARRMRASLAQEQGLDPSEAFATLEQAVLRADPALDHSPATITAAAPTATVTPAQLPLDVYGFAGREPELRRLAALTDITPGPPVVLITGTAGVGKTALAVHWAHRRADRFPDGQLYLNLRGFDPARGPMEPIEALRRCIRALGADPAAIPDDVEEAAALYRSQLARRRVLIVLDNARITDQVRPLLPGSAGCAVVVTSRDQLRGLVTHEGARPIQLEPLSPAEADNLLAKALDLTDSDQAAVTELAQRCAYLPLALRLAAAQLACHRHLTVVGYARQLAHGDTLSVLDTSSDTDAAVSSSFGLSYRALAPSAQQLFRLLSLVPGQDFTRTVAAALLGVTVAEGIRPLEELRMACLISEHQLGRYTMHDLLRSYAGSTLLADEAVAVRATATRRLVDFYAETVYEAYPLLQPRRLDLARDLRHPPREPLRFATRAAALAWHDQERDNLLGVIDLAHRHGWHHSAWQLTADLFAYFIIRRRWPDWLAALRIGHSSAQHTGDATAMAHMENAMGVVRKQIGDYAEARSHYRAAIRLAAAAKNNRMVAAFNANLGGLCVNEGNLETAVQHLQTALAIPEYGLDPQYATAAYVNLGCAFTEMDRRREAVEVLQRALQFAIVVDDVQQICHSHHSLAEIALRSGDRDTARHHAERQLHLAQDVGDPLRTAAALDMLASALAPQDLVNARQHWRAAGKIYEQLAHPLGAILEDWLRVLDTFDDPAELAGADDARRRRGYRLI
jgi:DNA-binding SARP family transcriptional activator/Tfp pilus assembly protein PilF